jgi:hypothetical protein
VTEERDYFQTKFLEQVSEIQALKTELERSKKEIARLRKEVMMSHHSNSGSLAGSGAVVAAATPGGSRAGRSSGRGGRPSVTSNPRSYGQKIDQICDDENVVDEVRGATNEVSEQQEQQQNRTKSVGRRHRRDDDIDDDDASSITYEEDEGPIAVLGEVGGDDDDDDNDNVTNKSSNEEDDEDHETNSAQDIRQSAARLLQWATYRTSSATPRNSSLGGSRNHDGDGTSLEDDAASSGSGRMMMMSPGIPKILNLTDEDNDDDDRDIEEVQDEEKKEDFDDNVTDNIDDIGIENQKPLSRQLDQQLEKVDN